MFKAKNYNVATPEKSGAVVTPGGALTVTIEPCIDITLKGGTFVSIECESEEQQKEIIKSLEGLINLKVYEI